MDDLTHLDLFSGIGGFALAASWCGFRTIGFSEIDPDCIKTLGLEWPGVKNFGDIRNAKFERLHAAVTVLTGGFPCQPWSRAGEKRGTGDNRHLWPAMFGAIKAIRPAWVIGENVPDIINLGGADLALSDLESIGYATQPFIVPASAIGAGHSRDRLWIIAHAGGEGLPRHQPDPSVSFPAPAPHAKPCDPIVREWDSLARCSRGIRTRDGLSVTMARSEVRGFGNAIVPQIAEKFFRFIAQIERGEITA